MAAVSRASILCGSEEAVDTPCSTCSSDDKLVEALYFCRDCQSSFCCTCISWHAKFPGTAGHQVSAINSKFQGQRSKSLNRPLPKPPVNRDLQRSGTWESNKKGANACPEAPPLPTRQTKQPSLLQEMERLRQTKVQLLKHIDDNEISNLTILQNMKDTLTELVSEESERRHSHARKTLRSQIEALESRIEEIKKTGVVNESQDKDLILELRQSVMLDLESPLIGKFKNFLSELESHQMYKTSLSAELLCEYDISVRRDQSVCSIYGSCFLEDGTVVLTDNANKRLKLLNRKNGACSYVDLPCGPWGVCSTNLYEVAVTLTNDKLVQFASLKESIVLTRSFGVNQFCRGICFSNGHLYISCGSVNEIDSSFVGVFTLSGQLVRKINRDPTGHPIFTLPHHVAVTSRGDRMYVADKNVGAYIVRQDGDVTRFRDKDLVKAFGICALDSGGFLVCGINSDTVVHVGDDGKKIGTLLCAENGIYGPYSLLVDNIDSSLIITFYQSNKLKVFRLL